MTFFSFDECMSLAIAFQSLPSAVISLLCPYGPISICIPHLILHTSPGRATCPSGEWPGYTSLPSTRPNAPLSSLTRLPLSLFYTTQVLTYLSQDKKKNLNQNKENYD